MTNLLGPRFRKDDSRGSGSVSGVSRFLRWPRPARCAMVLPAAASPLKYDWIGKIFWLLYAGLFAFCMAYLAIPLIISVPLILLLQPFRTAIHEGGHAAAALIVGGSVREIRLGAGPLIRHWTKGKFHLKLCGPPFYGYCSSMLRRRRFFRWCSIFKLLAGITAEWIFALGVYALPLDQWLGTPAAGDGSSSSFGPFPEGDSALQRYQLMLVFFTAFTTLHNLTPHNFFAFGRWMRTDGGQILDYLRMPQLKLDLTRIRYFDHFEEYKLAHSGYRQLLKEPSLDVKTRFVALLELAWLSLHYEVPQLMPKSLFWIDQARQLRPEDLTMKLTQGCLLAETRAFAPAKVFLRQVLESPAPMRGPRNVAAACLAWIAALEKDPPAARAYLAQYPPVDKFALRLKARTEALLTEAP